MKDITKLSDDELMGMIDSNAPGSELESISDSDLMAMAKESGIQEPEEGLLDQGLDYLVKAGEAIDSVTGAPTRAAIGAIQNDKNPLTAFTNQFAENPSNAPTGKEIAQKAGVTDASLSDAFPSLFTEDDKEAEDWLKFKKGGAADITTSGATGLGIDLIADPTLLIGSGFLKSGSKFATKLGKKSDDIIRASRAKRNTNIIKEVGESGAENIEELGNFMTRTLNPQRSKNYDRLMQIAGRNNIKPDDLPYAVEFGKNSLPSRMQRFKAEGPLGGPELDKMDAAFAQVDDAIEKHTVKVGGQMPRGEEYAGDVIREGFDEALDNLKGYADITYSNIHKHAPGIKLSESAFNTLDSKLNTLEKWAVGKVKRGINPEEGAHMAGIVKALRNNNGSIKQVVEAMQDVGELAFKSQNYLEKTPKDIKKLRELYFTMSDAVFDTVKTDSRLGKQFADRLEESNKVYKEFFDDKFFIGQIGSKKVSNAALFNNLIKRGDANQIKALKRLLSPEKFKQLKGEYLATLIKRNIDDEISVKSLHNSLRKLGERSNLFEPGEIEGIKELIELRSAMGDRVLSYSGTGQSNRFSDFVRAPFESVLSNTVGDTLTKRHINKARGYTERQATKQANKAKRIEKIDKVKTQTKNVATDKKLQRLASLSPAAARLFSSQKNSNEIKGREKWKLDGVDKVLDGKKMFSGNDIEKLLNSKKGSSLLVSISSMKIGSKAYDNHINKIEKYLKGKK